MLALKSNLLPTVSNFFEDDWNSLFDWNNQNFIPAKMTMPSVNIREDAEQFIVEMAAPGMKKENFQIELKNNTLSIRSEIQHSLENEKSDIYTRKEFSYQSFHRSFNFNNKIVDDANISATYQDGILRLTLPKKEEAKEKPARMIEIS